MRKVLTSLAVVAALAVASTSYAVTGTATMGWTGCNTTPITDLTIPDLTTQANNLMVFVTGHDDPLTAYQAQILYGNATTKTVPDAWRFDPAGCEGPSFVVINHLAPASVVKTCPTLRDAGGAHNSIEIKKLDFEPAGFPYPTTLIRAECAVALTAGTATPVAANKYFLMDVEFNMSAAVSGAGNPPTTCGGLEIPMCFNLNSATYLQGGTAAEIAFVFHGGATGDWATANAGGAGGCQNTPAQTKTWGQIKNQYRN